MPVSHLASDKKLVKVAQCRAIDQIWLWLNVPLEVKILQHITTVIWN